MGRTNTKLEYIKVIRNRAFFAAASVAILFSSHVANAMPGASTRDGQAGENMTTSSPSKSPKAIKCKRGETAKTVTRQGKRTKICVKLKADISPDAELYQNARMLADEGEYEWALDHLRLITQQDDAEVLNYTGYSNRKAGRLETGIAFYHKALAVNPDYVQAREYLGEAYVLAGRVDLANLQLTEIANRCGTVCAPYGALKQAIDAPRY